MPMPLKKGFNVHVEYIEKPSTYVMRAIDIYEDFYGIGFIVSGDRQTITPEKISFIHAGNVTPMTIGVYHRTYALSDAPYKRYGMKFTPKIANRCMEQIGEKNFHHVMSHLCYELSPACQKKVQQMFDDMLYEYEHYDSNSEFADEFLELSLFFKAFQALYSELLCIFPCFCPYGQFTRESFSECI